MKNYIKGAPGYIRHRKINLGIISLIGFLLIIGTFLAGCIITGTSRNYITILSVIIVLPTTKFFVQYLMISWKNHVNIEEFDNLQKEIIPLKLYCELQMTASEKSYEIIYLIVDKDDSIIAYTHNTKADTSKFEKGVTNFLNFYDFNANVKLYTDYKSFTKRARTLATRNKDNGKTENEHIALVFEKLSIMSI